MSFPTVWKKKPNVENQGVNVCVKLENGYLYTFIVATRKNYRIYQGSAEKNYFSPDIPFVVIKKIIAKTVQVYTEENDGHWLKSHNFSERIDTTVFDQLQAKEIDDTKNF